MTQKELLYVEDAISHEQSIIAYLNDSMSSLNDDKLSKFMDDEIKCHEKIKKELVNLLESESHE